MTDQVRHEDGWVIFPDGRRLRAISGGGPSGKSTVVSQTNIPPKTEEELSLIRKQNEFLDLQLQETRRQSALLEETFPQQKALFEAQTNAATIFAQAQKIQLEQLIRQAPLQEQLLNDAIAELKGTPEEQEIRKLSNERALAILKGEAPPLLPGQQERINTIFARAGEEAQTGLRTFGEDLAASRGMSLADSPIGNELLRQGKDLAASLAASKAAAELNVGQAEQIFGENVRQFQESLRQQGFQNRLALTGRSTLPIQAQTPAFGSGAGLAGFQGLTPMLGQLAQERIAGAETKQTTRFSTQPGIMEYVKVAAQLAQAAATAYAASSITFKKDVEPLDVDEYERARLKVAALPIARWRYTHEPDTRTPHIGVIAELSPDEIRAGPKHISLMDMAGLTLAAVKGVDRRIDRLEARLPVPSPTGPRLPVPARAA